MIFLNIFGVLFLLFSNFCRKSTQSRLSIAGLANFLPRAIGKQSRDKKAQSCTTLWFDECYDEYYRDSNDKFETEFQPIVNRCDKREEHKIRIEIKYDDDDDDDDKDVDDSATIICAQTFDEYDNNSSASVGVNSSDSEVSIAATTTIANENIRAPRIDAFCSQSAIELVVASGVRRTLGEKAIDCPKEFEEKAYAQLNKYQRNRSPLRRKVRPQTRQLNPIVNECVEVRNVQLLSMDANKIFIKFVCLFKNRSGSI